MTPNNGNPTAKSAPRSHLAASAGELQEFLQHLHGKNPHEILGAITQSGLARAFVQATLGTMVLVLVFTIAPFLIAKQFPTTSAENPAPAAETATSPASSPPTAGNPAMNPGAAVASPANPATPTALGTPATPSGNASPTEVLDKLGENITKPASPKVNPLDKKDDDLFKELIGK